MSVTLGRPLLLVAFVIALVPRSADAQVTDHAQCGTQLPACTTLRTNCCTRDFVGSSSQKAIIIPLDRCHQQIANGGANAPASGASAANAPDWCANSPGTSVKAMNRAYGLIYRLMQNGIPVYWIVNPTKAATTQIVNPNNTTPSTTPDARTKDVDFWVLSATGVTPTPTGALTNGTGPVDLATITGFGTASATVAPSATYAYGKNEFPLRGGAFLIAPDDRAAFNNFFKTALGRTCGTSGLDCYNFSEVWMYEVDPSAVFVWQDYSKPLSGGKYVEYRKQLPVAMRVDYEPPKVAAVDGNLLTSFLAEANLDDLDAGAGCTGAGLFAAKRVGCRMSEAAIQAGDLKTKGFNWLWLDTNASSSCTTTTARIRDFLTAVVDPDPTTLPDTGYSAGNAIFFNAAISVFAEGCVGDKGFLGSTAGLALSSGAVNETSADPLIIRYPSNLFAQYGDLELNFAAGAVTNWTRVSGSTSLYDPSYNSAPFSLRRLMTYENTSGTDCKNHKDSHVVGAASVATCDDAANAASADVQDIFSYGRYRNNSQNGIIFYSPGNNLTPSGQQAQLRMVLSSLIAMPPFIVDQTFSSIEVTRSDPIVATVGGVRSIVQGTYVYKYDVGSDGKQRTVPRNAPSVFVPDDISSFTFPALEGHLRATSTATSSIGNTAQNLTAGTTVMDVGSSTSFPTINPAGCATASGFNLGCRNVWTTTEPGYLATDATKRRVVVTTGNTAVGSAMLPDSGNVTFSATDKSTFISKILAGWDPLQTGTLRAQMGGIDRSTVAIIGPSPSYNTRPTIAYVGSTDGMLHAICMNDLGVCDTGKVLWSYIPRVNLRNLRYNTARIDSSPRVLDVRANFYGTGTIYTVLLFQAGNRADTEDETPAIYALDVSRPEDPRVVWEHASWDSSGLGDVFSPTLAACTTQVSCGRQTFALASDDGLTPLAATATARGTYALGEGITLAAGQADVDPGTGTAVRKNIVVAQTNNGGTGAAANVVTAIDIETGKRVWQRVNLLDNFIAPRTAAAINVPSTGIPPGAVPVDTTLTGTNGFMTDLVVGDLYGNLWLIDPENGESKLTTGGNEVPLFQFRTPYHPIARPAIYVEGASQFAVFSTGGYTDYSTNTLWGKNSTTGQYIIAVDLTQTSGLPLHETSSDTLVPVNVAIPTARGLGFSQPRIIGNEVFVTTDTSDVNAATFGSSGTNTGFVTSFNLLAPDIPTGTDTNYAQIRTGASALINDTVGGEFAIFSSSGSKRQRIATPAGANRNAVSRSGTTTTAPRQVTQTIRKLWLRTE